MSIKSGFDIYLVYRFVKDLSRPFDETEAFKLGLIDEKGKRLKKASSKEEKEAMTYYDRLIFNLKRLLAKVGVQSKIGTFAAAMFLLREDQDIEASDDQVILYLEENMSIISKKNVESYTHLTEEVANATGAAVAGTGSDPVHWVDSRRKRGRPRLMGKCINGVYYLKRAAKEARKRELGDR